MNRAQSRVVRALRRRPKFNIIAFTLTVSLAVGALQALDLWWRRDHVVAAAETRAANLTNVFAEYIRASFASADAALRQIAVHSGRVGGPAASHGDWDPILDSAKSALPEAGSVSVTDANGVITHSSLRAIVGQARRDNYVFQQLAAAAGDDFVVDRPYPARTQPPQYIIPVGRRLSRRGAFDGTVVATVLPESYREFFRNVDLGPGGTVTVFHPDGVVLFREPSAGNPINEAATHHPLFVLARRDGSGVHNGPAEPGGPRTVSAYRTIASPPLIVAVSLGEDAVLADWRRQRRVSVTGLGALALTLGALVYLYFRVVDARTRAVRELGEVQRLEAERLRDANERLEGALEREKRARQETEAASYLKDEFLMTVSHELRTPLTAIYGWARVLGTKEMTREQQARAIAAIDRNARAQTTLIDDLLDVSRAISGKLRLDARVVQVADVLRAAAETLGPAMAAKNIAFETLFDPDTPQIVADPDRLQQIVWNLLSNAIKFTPEGGSVQLRTRRIDSQVEIVVRDTGLGITPDFLPYVFERFRQGEAGSRRRYGGLGLGLAIVRHLVELHGGTVTAESAGENQGATFRVNLPVRPARMEGAAASAPAASARPRKETANASIASVSWSWTTSPMRVSCSRPSSKAAAPRC